MMVPTGLDNIKITFVTYFAINLLMTTGNELILRPIYGDFSLKKISMLIKLSTATGESVIPHWVIAVGLRSKEKGLEFQN